MYWELAYFGCQEAIKQEALKLPPYSLHISGSYGELIASLEEGQVK